ncbi:MAG: DUF3883 domain-containing protein [Actinobacteria bacterium]|nr:DUF3883 domain-containing protein [Actinomycetota bacterium]MCL5887667.1 DUF3883 domain-containing protein [Actinomycetota bacterium]
MKVLFCNVGWMEWYRGLTAGDRIVGGGAYVQAQGTGHEVCNFYPDDDTLYGYVQAPGAQVDIDRIGAGKGDNRVDGVLVVWTATRPGGGTVVVGWYRDATVYRDYQRFNRAPEAQRDNGIDGFRIKAPAASATLLPLDARVLRVPRQVKGGMGQSNVWYADSSEAAEFVSQVRHAVETGEFPRGARGQAPRQSDPDLRVKVEQAAIGACATHYEDLGYQVWSVEKDNVGWDLEAANGDTSLRIEVKGLSGSVFGIELTPNEYAAFNAQKPDYRLAVVLSALDNPKLLVCRYSEESNSWVNESTRCSLRVQEKRSATVWCD